MNRGPCNVIMGLRYAVIGTCIVVIGLLIMNRVPWNVIMGLRNVNRGRAM